MDQTAAPLRLRTTAIVAVLLAGFAACSPAGPARTPPAAPPPVPERAPARTPRTVRLGVVVPAGGAAYLQQYADAVVEGIKVAAAERQAAGDYLVELVVRTASSEAEAAAAVRELSAMGVLGIVGPLLEANVPAAAAARPDTSIVIVSPTATGAFRDLPNVYALNAPDTLGAAALGAYAVRTGAAPLAVLRPRSGPVQAQARAFSAAVAQVAGRAPLEVAYEPGTTNYSALLRRLRDARVRTLFVAAEESDLRQLLPQIDYYGLGGAQLLASGTWATPDGLERIGLRSLEGVITTLPFLLTDSAGTWGSFVREYEALHRRSLDNAIPALGYDAAALLLTDAAAGPAQTAGRLRAGDEVRGATGRLVPLRGSVGRRPMLVRILGGRAVPVTE